MQFRDIIAQVNATPRPLLDTNLQKASRLLDNPGSTFTPLPLTRLQTLVAAAVDLPSIQQTAHQRLLQQHAEVLASPALTTFENVGELFIFMESFSIEEYLAANPTSTDIMTDMTVMRTWLADLENCPSSVSHKLFFFDLAELRGKALEVAQRAVRVFLRLVRENTYDKSIDLQVRRRLHSCCFALEGPASDGLELKDSCYVQGSIDAFLHASEEAHYPADLAEFSTWMDRLGDHFTGSCSAYQHVLDEVESIGKIHGVLHDEHRSLSRLQAVRAKVTPKPFWMPNAPVQPQSPFLLDSCTPRFQPDGGRCTCLRAYTYMGVLERKHHLRSPLSGRYCCP